MRILVRMASLADGELIAALSRRTFYETFAPYNTPGNMDKFLNEQFSKETLLKEVGAPGNYFLLAYDEELPVGYARMKEEEAPAGLGIRPSLELARIYVLSSSTGKGVGKALLQQCIALAKELRKEIIWLGVWEKNQRAIDFYTHWGFEKFGTHIFRLGDDLQTDWLMKKTIC